MSTPTKVVDLAVRAADGDVRSLEIKPAIRPNAVAGDTEHYRVYANISVDVYTDVVATSHDDARERARTRELPFIEVNRPSFSYTHWRVRDMRDVSDADVCHSEVIDSDGAT